MMRREPLLESAQHPRASWLRNAAGGAGLGVLFALFCLGVGAVRILGALMMGVHVTLPTTADLPAIGFYVGGFVLAGGLLGLARPLLRTRAAICVGCACAGAVTMILIAAGDAGNIAALDRADWIMAVLLGAAFGCALATGYLRNH